MNDHQLLIFLTVAEKSSFSESAKILHMSQPTVTAQIKSLENELNAQLFHRTTKHVELTEAGRIFYRYSKEILRLMEQSQKEIDALKNSVSGTLEVAASLTIGEYILPKLLGRFNLKYPDVHLKMYIMNTEQIIEKIRNRHLHVGLVEGLIDHPDLRLRAFREDELVLITAPQFKHPALSTTDHYAECRILLEAPLILRETGSGTRQVLEQRMYEKGYHREMLRPYLELGSTEAVKGAVAENLGVSVISASAIEKEIKLGILRAYSFSDLNLRRLFYTVTLHDRALSRPAEAFLSEVVPNTLSN